MRVVHNTHAGFKIVPYKAVTLNCLYLPKLNDVIPGSYNGPWALVAPTGRVVDDEDNRPFRYETTNEASEDAKKLSEYSEWVGEELTYSVTITAIYVGEVEVKGCTPEQATAAVKEGLVAGALQPDLSYSAFQEPDTPELVECDDSSSS